jgi:YHS domain-containing protein
MNKRLRLMALLAVAAVVLVLGVTAQQKAGDKAVDPVCGMTVTKATAAATFDYKGTTYYFCSKGCKDAFAKEPEKYLAKTAANEEPKDVLVPAPHGAMGPGMHKMPMGQMGCPMMHGRMPMMGHGGPMGMGPGPIAGGVNRLLLRRDVDWTYEKTAAGVTVKISSKDPETVKAIQERLAMAKEMKETMMAPPAGAAGASSCSCPDCPMKEPVKK